MSRFFLKILRCIFCCDEGNDYENIPDIIDSRRIKQSFENDKKLKSPLLNSNSQRSSSSSSNYSPIKLPDYTPNSAVSNNWASSIKLESDRKFSSNPKENSQLQKSSASSPLVSSVNKRSSIDTGINAKSSASSINQASLERLSAKASSSQKSVPSTNQRNSIDTGVNAKSSTSSIHQNPHLSSNLKPPSLNFVTAEEANAKGTAAFSSAKFAEAIRFYTEAIDLAPSNHVLYSNRSASYTSLHQYKEALEDAKKTVELKPDWAKGYSRLGAAHVGLGSFDEAIADYKKGLEIDPNYEALKSGLSYAQSASSRSRFPPSSINQESLEQSYAKASHSQKSVPSTNQRNSIDTGVNAKSSASSIDQNPHLSFVSSNLKSPSLNFVTAEEVNAKGTAAFSSGNFSEAIRFFTEANDLAPSNHVLYSNRSASYASLHQYKEALEDAKKTVELKPDWAKGYSRLGAAHVGLGNFYQAIAAYKKGLEIDPNNEALKSGLSYAQSASTQSRFPPSSINQESLERSSAKASYSQKSVPSTNQRNSIDTGVNAKSSTSSINQESLKRSSTKASYSQKSAPSTIQRNSTDTGVNAKSSVSSINQESTKRSSTKASYSQKSVPPPLCSFEPPSSPSPLKPLPLCSLEPTSSSSPSPQSPVNASKKTKYVRVQKSTTPLYSVPENFKELIEKDIVPEVLKKRLTPSAYKNYFAALLYAEDFYAEKWSDYCLHNVTLELQKASIYANSSKNKNLIENYERDEKIFVAFQIDSIPERRPFLLSRDFVLLHPSGKTVEPFRGILYRVVKSTTVLAEFGDDFHLQHSSNRKYDISFTFNRVCLKRCHQALAAATDPLLHNFLFPNQKSRIQLNPPAIPSCRNLNQKQVSAVYNILRFRGPPPYLIEGPLSIISTRRQLLSTKHVIWEKELSTTGWVIREAVLQICRTSPGCRILINAPTNSICDVLMGNLKEEIPESDMFRANAAFRELDGVPYDILPLCPFEGECFTCPPFQELRSFKVVLSTFMSSFRLHNEGISPGHFTHIFLVDACLATEPETIVPLANLADEKTIVVITGATGYSSGWVRSDIARRCGLKTSYFQRLLETEPYCSRDPMFVMCIRENGPKLDYFNGIY